MTPNPPSSSEGSSLPPRHRPNKDSLSKDTTEQDLWALEAAEPDAELDTPVETEAVVMEDDSPEELVKPPVYAIPGPRLVAKPRLRPTDESFTPADAKEGIRMNVGKNRPGFQHPPSILGKSESEFDELDHWDETEAEPAAETHSEPDKPVDAPDALSEASSAHADAAPVVAEVVDVATDGKEEFSTSSASAKSDPGSLRPKLGLSKVERIGLMSLLALLVLGGGVVFLKAIISLPSSSAFEDQVEFPVKGERVEVLSAETFWRAPVTAGEKRDIVRRGTELIPVVVLRARGGPAAIRVFFRNSEGVRIGDAVTRLVSSESTFEMPSTAGFEEAWMHDAYRTGNGKPWTIEVYEAASENSPASDFKRLFESPVSSGRR